MSSAGKLKHIVEIWGKVPVEDSAGNPETDKIGQAVMDKIIIGEPYAEMVPKTGSMLSGRVADTVLSKTTHMIRIRYRSKYELLKPDTNWIMYKGHRFNIDYILNPYSKNEFLEIFCSEVV
jgi:head-tail adaptor